AADSCLPKALRRASTSFTYLRQSRWASRSRFSSAWNLRSNTGPTVCRTMYLTQPFINAAQMPHAERFEVDQAQGLSAAVHIAGQPVEAKREIAILDGIPSEEFAALRLLAENPPLKVGMLSSSDP